ncbi:MAG: restriction endonuclease subunit S, partial [Propionibacteriaceae bacterium]|nr:restriction endonuclease subunit S [Propionibacteriaceae bacterium]
MSDWTATTLNDIAVFSSGGTPSKANADFWNGDIPWISAESLKTIRLCKSDRNVTRAAINHGTKIAPKGSVLVLVRGMSLHQEIRVGWAQRGLAFNQDVKALAARPGVDPSFLFYTLDGCRAELLGLVHAAGHGTGVLATDQLKALP